jgi:hypothetical protein
MRSTFTITRVVALSLATALLFAPGCARTVQDVTGPPAQTVADLELDPQAVIFGDVGPLSSTAGAFYPLVVGNHWTYDARFLTTVIDSAGNATATAYVRATDEHELLCSTAASGNTYVAERQTFTSDVGTGTSWVVYRQDGRGLYEVDDAIPLFTCGDLRDGLSLAGNAEGRDAISALAQRAWAGRAPSASAARERWLQREWTRQIQLHQQIRAALGIAPGERPFPGPPSGALPGEITRLRYPLRPGQRWIIRDDPLLASRVVAREKLRIGAVPVDAFKIQITSELFGPSDRVYIWYGRVGYVGMIAEVSSTAMDDEGNPLGRLVTQQQEILTSYELQSALAAK